MILFLSSSGFARSFGMRLANGERREWIKPIMFSGGLGSIEDQNVKKEPAEQGTRCIIILLYLSVVCLSIYPDLVCLFARHGGGENWRPSVQDWCWWRCCLFYTGAFQNTLSVSDLQLLFGASHANEYINCFL